MDIPRIWVSVAAAVDVAAAVSTPVDLSYAPVTTISGQAQLQRTSSMMERRRERTSMTGEARDSRRRRGGRGLTSL
jgi:hypothetical protein